MHQNSRLARHQRIYPKDAFLHFSYYFFCCCDNCSLDFISVGLINIMRCAMLRAMQWLIHVKQLIKTTRMVSDDQRKIWLKLLIRDQQIGLNQNLLQQYFSGIKQKKCCFFPGDLILFSFNLSFLRMQQCKKWQVWSFWISFISAVIVLGVSSEHVANIWK